MRFMKLVQCGSRNFSVEDASQVHHEDQEAAPPPSAASIANRRRNGRPAATHSAPTMWRPSLAAISEIGTPATPATAGKEGIAAANKAKAAGAPRRVLPRPHTDDTRYGEVNAFTPTAFLF